jgi:hypothetical protein
MPAGTSLALAVLRVPRGASAPSPERLREALDEDRDRLRLPRRKSDNDVVIAGPYPIEIGDQELDEYVVWER